MKTCKKLLCLLLVLMIAASVCVLASCGKEGKDKEEGKEISFTFTVVDKDGNETNYPITTSKTTLRQALADEKLIGETKKGALVNTVCGVTLDYQKDGAYWGLYIGDEMAMVGVDDIRPEEGAVYRFVYTPA